MFFSDNSSHNFYPTKWSISHAVPHPTICPVWSWCHQLIQTEAQTWVQPSESKVVSLAAQQQCSRLSQNASRHTPSFRSDIHVAPMSTTAAQTPATTIIQTHSMLPVFTSQKCCYQLNVKIQSETNTTTHSTVKPNQSKRASTWVKISRPPCWHNIHWKANCCLFLHQCQSINILLCVQ